MNKEEKFVDIVGYEGYYQVSNCGCIRSVDRFVKHHCGGRSKLKGKTLKGFFDPKGYVLVSLNKLHNKKTTLVHRIVAQAFLILPQSYYNKLWFVNHINGDKSNNNVSNLKYTIEKNVDVFSIEDDKNISKLTEYLSTCA